ncbi:MAG: hypothetical protein WDA41_07910 [Candidatus Neomarinimicrobiota bacterium]
MAIKNPFGFLTGPVKKVKTKGLLLPSFLRTATTRGATSIRDTTPDVTNTDIVNYRNLVSQKDVIKALGYTSPDISQAINTLIRFAITDEYRIIAKTFDGMIDEVATNYAQALAARFDCLPPDYDGFYTQTDLRSTSESLLRQLVTYGALSGELVLSAARVPSFIRAISVKDIKFEAKGTRAVPYVESNSGGASNKIYLDSPLFFFMSLDQDLDEAYPISPLTASVQPVLFSEEFKQDLRRAFRKAALPRLTARIDSEKFKESLPAEIRYDEEKLTAYMSSLITDLESRLNDLNPEDAIVFFDILDIKHHSAGNISFHENMKELRSLIDGNVASGVKTLPSVLGRGESQSVASTESMLYLRYVEGMQEKINSFYSRVFTLALRLLGFDVYCTFRYADPELRPKSELESFYSLKQSRVLEQLSYGFISDTEASIELTGRMPSGNFTPLSGTRFNINRAEMANPYSNTSVTPDGVTATKNEKDIKSTAPAGTRRSGGQKQG